MRRRHGTTEKSLVSDVLDFLSDFDTLPDPLCSPVQLGFDCYATDYNSVNLVVITSSANRITVYVDGTAAGMCKVCFTQSVPMTQVLMTQPGGWT